MYYILYSKSYSIRLILQDLVQDLYYIYYIYYKTYTVLWNLHYNINLYYNIDLYYETYTIRLILWDLLYYETYTIIYTIRLILQGTYIYNNMRLIL